MADKGHVSLLLWLMIVLNPHPRSGACPPSGCSLYLSLQFKELNLRMCIRQLILCLDWLLFATSGLEPVHPVSAPHLPQRARPPVAVQEPGHGRHAAGGGAGQSHLLLRRRRNHEDEDPTGPLQRRQQQPPWQPQKWRQVHHIDNKEGTSKIYSVQFVFGGHFDGIQCRIWGKWNGWLIDLTRKK